METNLNGEYIQKIWDNKRIRQRLAFESPFWFSMLYLRHHFDDPLAPFHMEMFHLIEQLKYDLIVVMAFRESGKSTILNMVNVLWSILGKPGRKFVIIISKTQDQAKNHFTNIKRELENNERLKEDFGPFTENPNEWNKLSLELEYHGSKIISITREQSIRGMKHNQHRPDLIICDDMEDFSSVVSPIESEIVYDHFKSEIVSVGSKNTRIIVLGNLISENSLIMKLRKEINVGKNRSVFRAYPLLDDNGKNLWAEKFIDKKAIKKLWDKSGTMWGKEYLLNVNVLGKADKGIMQSRKSNKKHSKKVQTPLVKQMKKFIISAPITEVIELEPVSWIQKHGIKTSTGKPMEFEDHAFMQDFINDMSPLQVLLKPPQIGASESQIIKTLYCAKTKHWDIVYTLPTDADRNDMVGGKVNRIIAQNPETLGEWTKDHDTVEQKSVGKNIIHYRGTYTPKKAMMVSSDLNVHDEVDASDPDVITQYENRLEAKADGKRWYFSHPSIQGFGVDIYWQQSDKKEWFVTCPHCQNNICLASQDLSWRDSIDFDRGVYICRLCKGELTEEDRKVGRWIATAQGIFSGYHISQLMCPWISAQNIINKKKDPLKDEQFFHNYVLGLPYVGSENKISSETVLKNVRNIVNRQTDRIIIGVDTGLPWYLTCMNSEGVFYREKLKNVGDEGTDRDYDPKNRVRELLNRWPISIVIGDQAGELSPLRILQQEFPGRVFLCFYRKDKKSLEPISWGENEEQGRVTVDRNRMFQIMVEYLRDSGRIILNGTKEDWQEWAVHFDNVYRETRVAKNTPGKDVATNYGPELIWKRNGPDHYCHTLLYCLVGMSKYAQGLAQIIKCDPFMAGVPVASNVDGSINAGMNSKKYRSFFKGSGGLVEDF